MDTTITNATNERSGVFALLPFCGAGDNVFFMLPQGASARRLAALLGALDSLPLDYVVRQKLAGVNMSFFYVKQIPVLPPSAYSESDLAFIVPRVAELVYTSWDMTPFFVDLWAEWDKGPLVRQWNENVEAIGGDPGRVPEWIEDPGRVALPPFVWDEERRAVLRAELDAYYARLYGLTEEELRYILDPADVYGDDFPGETFRVLKKKEIKRYGEYRTRRLVLEAWGRLG